jgi:hypothetical protein
VNKIPSKERRKELRREYEKIQGERYTKELQKTHDISLFEWVEYLTN